MTETIPDIPGFSRDALIVPESQPFALLGENRSQAVLMIHGLTGSPADFRTFAERYDTAGFDVYTPLVPGHGSHISVLERLGYRELFLPFEPLMAHLQKKYAKVHVIALSYGSILGVDLALRLPPLTLALLAPAFYLSDQREKKIRWTKRLRLDRFRSRISKKKVGEGPFIRESAQSYDAVATKATLELHRRSEEIRPQVKALSMPVFHAHGNRDDTCPIKANRDFLTAHVVDYTFHHVPGGRHVLPLDPGATAMAEAHLAWLASQEEKA